MKEDLYSVLGVRAAASQQEIERAYQRRKVEIGARGRASEDLDQLEKAFSVLGDHAKRAAYDRLRARGALETGSAAPQASLQQVSKPVLIARLWKGELHPGHVFLALVLLPFMAFLFMPTGLLWLRLLQGGWFLLAAVILWRSAFRVKYRFWGYLNRAFVVCMFLYQAIALPARWYSPEIPGQSAPVRTASPSSAGAEGCTNVEALILQAVTGTQGERPEETAFLQTAEGKYLAAALAGRLNEVKQYLDTGVSVDARDKRRRFWDNSALDHAARTDNVDLAKLLISRGADVNARSNKGKGHAALHVATGLGRQRIAEFLLQNKADPNLVDSSTGAPLDVAVLQARPSMARLLLKYGADKNAPGYGSPLKAIGKTGGLCNGHKEIIKLLIDAGTDLFAEDKDGRSGAVSIVWRGDDTAMVLAKDVPALDWNRSVTYAKRQVPLLFVIACAPYSNKTLEYLLTEHPRKDQWRVSASGPWGSLLHCASRKPPELVKLLLDIAGDVNAVDERGNTPLHVSSDPVLVTALIQRGAKVDAQDGEGKTPAMRLLYQQTLFEPVVLADANLSLMDKKGLGVVHHAVAGNYAPAVRLLIERKADVNLKDSEGKTALHYLRGREVMDLLLAAGADLNVKAANGQTPLHTVAATSSSELTSALIEKGADPLARASNGTIPLHGAITDGSGHQVRALLTARPKSVDALDDNGRSALHYAAERGSPAVISTLVDHGAVLERPDRFGNTPLHLAVLRENAYAAAHLVKLGADARRVNKEKKSAFDLVQEGTRPEQLSKALRGEPIR